jgi:hypothetical protein
LSFVGGTLVAKWKYQPLTVCQDVAVLGRFVYALNEFRRERHALIYDIEDYHIYNFASVRMFTNAMQHKPVCS